MQFGNLQIVTLVALAPFKWSDLGRFRHTGAKVNHNLVRATLSVCNYSTQEERKYIPRVLCQYCISIIWLNFRHLFCIHI